MKSLIPVILSTQPVINNSWIGERPNKPTYWPEGKHPSQDNLVSMQSWPVDHDYIPTMGMDIKQGRNFQHAPPSDSTGIILNESAEWTGG